MQMSTSNVNKEMHLNCTQIGMVHCVNLATEGANMDLFVSLNCFLYTSWCLGGKEHNGIVNTKLPGYGISCWICD